MSGPLQRVIDAYHQTPQHIKAIGDGAAFTVAGLGALAGISAPLLTVASLLYMLIRIHETDTCRGFLRWLWRSARSAWWRITGRKRPPSGTAM